MGNSIVTAVDDTTSYVVGFVEDITGDGDRNDELFIYDNAYIGPEYLSRDDGLLNRRISARDVCCAAWMIEDSLEGYPADRYPRSLQTQKLRKLTTLLHRLETLRDAAIAGLVLLFLFETPIWCNQNPLVLAAAYSWPWKWPGVWPHPWTHWSWLPDWLPFVHDKSTAAPPSSDPTRRLQDDAVFNPEPHLLLPVADPDLGCWIEGFFILVVTIYFLYEMYWRRLVTKGGLQGIAIGPLPRYFVLLSLVMWCDLMYYYKHRQTTFRCSPYCRILFLFSWKRVRLVFSSAAGCVREFTNVALFMLGTVLFCGWLMSMVLEDYAKMVGSPEAVTGGNSIDPGGGSMASLNLDGRPPKSWQQLGGTSFGNFFSANMSFFALMTGAGWPDITLAMFESLPWMIFLFIPFMIATFFLFTQLMLAVVYNAYQDSLKVQLKYAQSERTKGFALAFTLLAKPGRQKEGKVVLWTNFKEVLMHLPLFPKMRRHVTSENLVMLCTAMDDGTGELTFAEFHEACDIMLYHFWVTPEKSLLMRKCRWDLYNLGRFVKSGKLDHLVNVILGFNFLFICYESYLDLSKSATEEPGWVKVVEMFFSTVYMIEVIMKLMIEAFSNYASKPSNVFDFVVSILLFAAGVVSNLPAFQHSKIKFILPFLNVLRMLRLLKLVQRVPRFQQLAKCISDLIAVSREMLILILATFAVFAVAGVQMFGGKLYKDSPFLKDLDFNRNHYYDFSFDDMPSAFLAIFSMMVKRYIVEYQQAMDRVFVMGGWKTWWGWSFPVFSKVGSLYCTAFYFYGFLIVFNVATAFTIQVLTTLKDEQRRQSEQQELLKEMEEEAEDGDITAEDLLKDGDFSDEDKILRAMNFTQQKEDRICHIKMPADVLRARLLMKVYTEINDKIIKMRKKTTFRINNEIFIDKCGDHGTWGVGKTMRLEK